MVENLFQGSKLKLPHSENQKLSTTFGDEFLIPGSKNQFSYSYSNNFSEDYTEDFLQLAHLAEVSIPKKLGLVMINLLRENISPLSIRNTLLYILKNSSTKRIPQRKNILRQKLPIDSSYERYGGHDVLDADSYYDVNNDGSIDSDDNFINTDENLDPSENYSTASQYLISNKELANLKNTSFVEEITFSKSPYYKQLPITGGVFYEMDIKQYDSKGSFM